MEQSVGEGGGRVTDVGVEEMSWKPSSSWRWMSHSVRCSGAHSTMYCVCPYSVSLCLDMMRVTSQGGKWWSVGVRYSVSMCVMRAVGLVVVVREEWMSGERVEGSLGRCGLRRGIQEGCRVVGREACLMLRFVTGRRLWIVSVGSVRIAASRRTGIVREVSDPVSLEMD